MCIELVHIGFGNLLAFNKVVAIVPPNSEPTKRLIREARERGGLIDMTSGRKTKAAILLDTGQLALSAITPETIASRIQMAQEESMWREIPGVEKD